MKQQKTIQQGVVRYAHYLTWAMLLVGALQVHAQDPTFSQYFNNKQYLNPAYAGSENGIRANAIYRNQWRALPGVFNTFAFAGDMGIGAAQGGVGLLVLNDRTGQNSLNTSAAYLNIQKLVKLISTNDRLCVAYFAVQSGFVQKKFDWNNVVFSDQLDPVLGITHGTTATRPEVTQKNYADFGAGTVIRYKTGNHYSVLGLSATHLNRPSQAFYGSDSRLPMKWALHYIAQIPLTEVGMNKAYDTYISPCFIAEKQGYSEEVNIGALLHQNILYGGLGYRFKRFNLVGQKVDAAIVHLGFSGAYDNSYHWQIGYSYDITISDIRTGTSGTHEISLTLEYDKLRLGKRGMLTKTKDCINLDSKVKHLPVF